MPISRLCYLIFCLFKVQLPAFEATSPGYHTPANGNTSDYQDLALAVVGLAQVTVGVAAVPCAAVLAGWCHGEAYPAVACGMMGSSCWILV